jgi:phosphomannomutase
MNRTEKTNKFLFDVDGTLTPSRGTIKPEFEDWFHDFCLHNRVYLVTGSDYPKTLEQLGADICSSVQRVYNCSGNEIWSNGHKIGQNDWNLNEAAESWLLNALSESKFPLRTGNHIEKRTGTVNFSVVGRNATLGERLLYRDWDQKTNERMTIAQHFNEQFPELQAQVGGETGIDIFKKGCDKGQVLKDFNKNDKLYFFGDRTEPGGNDYPIAHAIENTTGGSVFKVDGWQQTFETLQYFVEAKIAE